MRLANKHYLTVLAALAVFESIQSQPSLVVFGKMKLEEGRLAGKLEVTENGTRIRMIDMSGAGKFDQQLKLNSDYVFSFSQDGYVSKKIAINTNVPEGRAEAEPFTAFEFHVTLFKQYEGVNFVVFNQPVGRVHYIEDDGDFGYDTDYSKSIQEKLEQVEKEVEEKKQEAAAAPKQEPPPDPPKKEEPVITEDVSIRRVAPPTTPRRRMAPPPPPAPKKKASNIVVLHSYTVGEMGYPNLNAYGFINFGDGAGRREITKEQFDEYARQYD